jgi:nucleotidyltransferase/DNA polymerase involved in DNA repair
MAVMAGRPTDALWGIGARTARKLAAAGITSVGQLARADPVDLAGRFGPTMGPWYRAVALGAGSTEVSAEPYVTRSRSRETTFERDITERAELDEQLVVLARRVAQGRRRRGPARPARGRESAVRPLLHPDPQPHPAPQRPAPRTSRRRRGCCGTGSNPGARCGCWECGPTSTGRGECRVRRPRPPNGLRRSRWPQGGRASGSSAHRPPAAR